MVIFPITIFCISLGCPPQVGSDRPEMVCYCDRLSTVHRDILEMLHNPSYQAAESRQKNTKGQHDESLYSLSL